MCDATPSSVPAPHRPCLRPSGPGRASSGPSAKAIIISRGSDAGWLPSTTACGACRRRAGMGTGAPSMLPRAPAVSRDLATRSVDPLRPTPDGGGFSGDKEPTGADTGPAGSASVSIDTPGRVSRAGATCGAQGAPVMAARWPPDLAGSREDISERTAARRTTRPEDGASAAIACTLRARQTRAVGVKAVPA